MLGENSIERLGEPALLDAFVPKSGPLPEHGVSRVDPALEADSWSGPGAIPRHAPHPVVKHCRGAAYCPVVDQILPVVEVVRLGVDHEEVGPWEALLHGTRPGAHVGPNVQNVGGLEPRGLENVKALCRDTRYCPVPSGRMDRRAAVCRTVSAMLLLYSIWLKGCFAHKHQFIQNGGQRYRRGGPRTVDNLSNLSGMPYSLSCGGRPCATAQASWW
mmetsp:Transcript_8728/g.27467  ORF Transcript_8728/g.27467 Transcript_8728/m.27467 type:complete len:216 (+) Transcript_8728:556-1203(+)